MMIFSPLRAMIIMLRFSLFAFVVAAIAGGISKGEAPDYPDKTRLLLLKNAAGKDQPISDPSDWKRRRQHILDNMQRVMGPQPAADRKVALDPVYSDEVDLGYAIRRKVAILVEKNDRLTAYLLIPKKRTGKIPAMLCLHPTSREWGKGIVVGIKNTQYRPDTHYALHLAERGYATLAPDYVNMGEYKNDPYAHGYISATMKGIWNHQRCIDFLQSLPEIDPERIGTIGHSLGGHNSIFVAVFDERVKVTVSSCGFCRFPTYMKGNLAGWSHDGYMPRIKTQFGLQPNKMPWDFPEAIAAIAPRGFFACAPVNDGNFDRQGAEDCLRAAQPVYDLLKASDRLQGDYPPGQHEFPDSSREKAYQFIDRVLQHKN